MSRKFFLSGCAALVLGSLSVALVAAAPPVSQPGGDTTPISAFVDDGHGAVSFNIDVNGDVFGSIHYGTVTCPRAVRIVSEQRRRDGGGQYQGSVNGNIYTYRTECANFAGVHMTIQLAY